MKILKNTILFLAVFIASPLSVSAARLYVLPTRIEAQANEPFRVELRLDAQNEEVNALDLRLEIPLQGVRLGSFSDRSSLINIWIEKPQTTELSVCTGGKTACKAIKMSGVAPGGFIGDGLIIELILIAEKTGSIQLNYSADSTVLLNRSDAQPAFVISNGARLAVLEHRTESEEGSQPVSADKTPPEEFKIHLAKAVGTFENKWFLSFAAQDKDSGVAYYEVREVPLGILGGEWIKTESPFVLHSQNLLSTIYVRAVNHNGQIRESRIVPAQLQTFYGNIIGLLLVATLVFGARKMILRLPKP